MLDFRLICYQLLIIKKVHEPSHVIIVLITLIHFLTLKAQMDSALSFDTINLGWSIVYIEGSQITICPSGSQFVGKPSDPKG